jgi:anti-sigma B factor antagonist
LSDRRKADLRRRRKSETMLRYHPRLEFRKAVMTVHIGERFESGFIILKPFGRMDSQSSPELITAIEERLKGSTNIVLDLTDVPYVSSAGMRVFLKIAKHVAAAQGKFALAALRPDIYEVLKISGLTRILSTFDTPESALSALATG